MRLLLFKTFVASVTAIPSIYFPVNSQVPPVARASQFFEYQFSASTFAPLTESFTYTTTNAPAWLALNGPGRTLFGTPRLEDVGAATFNLTASDTDGSTNMEVTLVVVSHSAPHLSMSISDQLAQAGRLTGPRSLALYPSTPFTLQFSPGTFVAAEKNLSYYATLSNHTPLPSWLNFDADRLQFDGTAPQLTASPQFFEVLLIAADVVGFAGGWASFVLVLTWHQLYFDPWEREIGFDNGMPISFPALGGSLMFDGSPYNESILDGVNASLPQWLVLDHTSYNISGTPPSNTAAQDVNVTATDIFGDTATAVVHLQRRSTLILSEIGTLNATIGEPFNYTIPRSSIAPGNYSVTVDFGSASPWFNFDPVTFNIQGHIPQDVKPTTIIANLVVSSSASGIKQSQMFRIRLQKSQAQSPSTATLSTRTSPSNTSSSSPKGTQTGSSGNSGITKGTILVVVIVVAIVVFLLALLLFWLCMRKKRRRWEGAPPSPSRGEIPRPMMSINSPRADIEKTANQTVQTPERVPRLDVDLPDPTQAAQPRYRRSMTTPLEDGDAAILADFNRSSWGFRPNAHAPHDSMKIPAELARLSRVSETLPLRRYPRHSVRGSNGLPFNRRLTGIRHGRSPYGSSAREEGSISTRNPYDCNSYGSYSTQSTGMLSTTPSAFPVPTKLREGRGLQKSASDADKRKSIRLVNSGSLVDQRPLSERRQSYIRQRAVNKSPFFGGSASRTSSQSKRIPELSVTDLTEHSGSPSRRRRNPAYRATLPPLSSVESPLQTKKGRNVSWRTRIGEGFPRVASSTGAPSSVRDSEQFESASNSSWYSDDEDLISPSHENSENLNSPQKYKGHARPDIPENVRTSWKDSIVTAGATAGARRSRLGVSRAPLSTVANESQRLNLVHGEGQGSSSVDNRDFWKTRAESPDHPDGNDDTGWRDGSVRGNAAFL